MFNLKTIFFRPLNDTISCLISYFFLKKKDLFLLKGISLDYYSLQTNSEHYTFYYTNTLMDLQVQRVCPIITHLLVFIDEILEFGLLHITLA